MKIAYLPVILVSFLLVGCESTPHYNRTSVVTLTEPQPKKPYGSVKLYESEDEVQQPYDVLAILSVDGKAGEEAAFIKAFLYRAADLGADAVIVQRLSVAGGTGGGAAGMLMPLSPSQNAAYRGEAIKYR